MSAVSTDLLWEFTLTFDCLSVRVNESFVRQPCFDKIDLVVFVIFRGKFCVTRFPSGIRFAPGKMSFFCVQFLTKNIHLTYIPNMDIPTISSEKHSHYVCFILLFLSYIITDQEVF